ncbi:tyrosine-protein phosphatase 69D-like [Branchiostoma floridae x Branchiostoma japonicum]
MAGVPTVPRNVRLTNLSFSELRVTWDEPDNLYGPDRGYVINLYTSTDSGVVKNGIDVAQNHSTDYNFGGLEAATSYTVEVRANNDRNLGPPGNATARTSDGLPSSPTNISRQEEGTHCDISWSSPAKPRGDIIGYNVHVQGHYPSDSRERQDGEYVMKSTTSTSIRLLKSTKTEIVDLLPNSVYTITVTGFTYTGEGNFSRAVNCTVPPGKPSKPEPPVRILPAYLFSTTVPLQVQPASERNGPIGCYHVVVVKSSSTDNLPDPEMLQPDKTLEEAKNSGNDVTAYIAMALTPDAVGESTTVTVGDGRVTSCNPQHVGRKRRALTSADVYNQEYTNSPLQPGSSYTTSVRAYGRDDGDQPYFSASQYMDPVSTATDREGIPVHLAGMIGLGAVSALLLVALFATIAVIVVLKRRLASAISKRESSGTTVQNDAFDDTYYTDTRTNRANNDGTYCDVIDDDITKRRGPAYGTSQDGEYNTPDVGGEEGAYQTLDPRTLETGNNEYQKLAKKRVFQQS